MIKHDVKGKADWNFPVTMRHGKTTCMLDQSLKLLFSAFESDFTFGYTIFGRLPRSRGDRRRSWDVVRQIYI